jgi:SAM-dependent methyltransferase
MNWKLKAHAMAVLSRVPGGRPTYHRLQRWMGTNRLDVRESLARAAEVVEMIRAAGRDPCRGTYLEVGTGWRPFLPFLLHLIGAERIITVDINPWLSHPYAVETCAAFAGQLDALAERLQIDPELMRRRYEVAATRTRDLHDLLSAFGVEYRCPADARETGLPDQSVDYVCSSNVLEHIPPDVLLDIHRESFRVLKPGGLSVHRFNPQDHYSTFDRSITGVNFLQYSAKQWRWYGGSGLSYHNRLRCPQHRDLFEAAGLAVATERVRIDPRAAKAIEDGQITINPDFAQYSPQELAADYMWVVARREDGVPEESRASAPAAAVLRTSVSAGQGA